MDVTNLSLYCTWREISKNLIISVSHCFEYFPYNTIKSIICYSRNKIQDQQTEWVKMILCKMLHYIGTNTWKFQKLIIPRSDMFLLISWTFSLIFALQKLVCMCVHIYIYIYYLLRIDTVLVGLESTHPIMYSKSISKVYFYLYFIYLIYNFLPYLSFFSLTLQVWILIILIVY